MASRLMAAAVTVGLLTFLFLCQYPLAQHLNISIEASSVLLAGTNQALNCTVTGPTGSILTGIFSWLRNGSLLLTTPMTNSYAWWYVFAILEFNPLRTSDSGQYLCVVSVTSHSGGTTTVNVTDGIELNVTSKWVFSITC